MGLFCRACGHRNTPDARFCENCGAPMAGGPPAVSAAEAVPVVQDGIARVPAGVPGARRAVWIGAAAAGALLLAGAVLLVWWLTPPQPTPERLAQAYAAQQGRDAEALGPLLCMRHRIAYDQPTVTVNVLDGATMAWMDKLVDAGLYEAEADDGSRFAPSRTYRATEAVRPWVRQGRLCMAAGLRFGGIADVKEAADGRAVRAVARWVVERPAPWFSGDEVLAYAVQQQLARPGRGRWDWGAQPPVLAWPLVFERQGRQWVLADDAQAASRDRPVSSEPSKPAPDAGGLLGWLKRLMGGTRAHPFVGTWSLQMGKTGMAPPLDWGAQIVQEMLRGAGLDMRIDMQADRIVIAGRAIPARFEYDERRLRVVAAASGEELAVFRRIDADTLALAAEMPVPLRWVRQR